MESYLKKNFSKVAGERMQFVSAVEQFQQYEPVVLSPIVLPSPEGRQPAAHELDLYEDYQPVVLSPLTSSLLQSIVDKPKTTSKKQRRLKNPRMRRESLQCKASPPPSGNMAGCTPPAPLQGKRLVAPCALKAKRCLFDKFAYCSKESSNGTMTF